MSRLEECNNSLNNAKNELVEMELNRDKFDKLFRKYYSLGVEKEENMSIRTLMAKLEAKHKKLKRRLIWIFGLAYPAVLAFWTAIGVIFDFKPSSTFVSTCTSVFFTTNMDNFSKCRKLKAERKYLDEVVDYLGNNEENLDMPVDELMAAMTARNEELCDEVLEKKRAIKDYETMLEDVKKEIANEVIEEHGIEAEIQVDFVKKTKKPKSLIKINVNK